MPPVSVGLLRKDALLVDVFTFHDESWTHSASPTSVPQEWTAYGYDGSILALDVGPPEGIPDDRYDVWGYTTDYAADTSGANERPTPRIGVAVSGPTRPGLLVPMDTGTILGRDLARMAWSTFESIEQETIRGKLETELCANVPRGADCDLAAERRRMALLPRVSRGHPTDSLQRTRGRVQRLEISGTLTPIGALALYHVRLERWYPSPTNPNDYCGPVSYFSASIVLRGSSRTVTDARVVLSDCDGKELSGITPRALLVLGDRAFVVAERWAWEEGETIVRELGATGLVDPEVASAARAHQ